MKTTLYILILIASMVTLFGCDAAYESDYYLETSTYISDPAVPELPIYSEFGYNTFGVRLDRDFIIFRSDVYPAKVFVEGDTTSFIFNGIKKSTYEMYNLTFKVANLPFEVESDLVALNKQTFNLKSDSIAVEIYDQRTGRTFQPRILTGELNFQRLQSLQVDEDEKGVIMSGTFQFKTIINNTPVAFMDGRFDVIIGYSTFYVLD